jgi:hypothetical protein
MRCRVDEPRDVMHPHDAQSATPNNRREAAQQVERDEHADDMQWVCALQEGVKRLPINVGRVRTIAYTV